MRFSDLPISEDFRNPVPGSVFSWGGHEYLVRIGKFRAAGPHANQHWIFQGDEIVHVSYTPYSRDFE
ncbi:MAG: hypothetical protein H6970_12275 [Gammaproteobacteria bacterium]|nr:hypothetical protein [Gammaproteobacteria bacterium]